MPSVEPINLRVTATASGLKSELGSAQTYIRTFAQQVEGQNRQIGGALGTLGASLRSLTALPALAAGGGIGFGLKLAADAETTKIRFETLAKSASEAKKVIAEVTEFAKTTPFELPEVKNAAALLLSVNFASKDLKQELRALGNISAAAQIPFNDLAEIVQKAKSSNTIFNDDLNRLSGRGINIIGALAEQFGVANEQVKKLAADSKISFEDLNQALLKIGLQDFAGATERLATTTAGKFSNLKDDLSQIATEFGTHLLPAINKGLDGLNGLIGYFKSLDESTIKLAANIVVFTGSFAATVAIIPRVIAAFRTIIVSMRALAAATVTVQALSGPKGWATLAISVGVAAGAVYLLNDSFNELERQAAESQNQVAQTAEATKKSVDKVTESIEDANAQLQKQAELIKQVQSLTLPKALIRDSGAELEARMKQALQSINRVDTGERNTGLLEEANKHLRDIKSELRKADSTPPLHVI